MHRNCVENWEMGCWTRRENGENGEKFRKYVQSPRCSCPMSKGQCPKFKRDVQNVYWRKAGKGKNRCDGVGVGLEQKEGERGEVVG